MTERSSIDDIIDLYKRDVDVSLIEENLGRSVEERLERLMDLQRAAEEAQRVVERAVRDVLGQLEAVREQRRRDEGGS